MKTAVIAAALAILAPAATAEMRCYISLSETASEGMHVTTTPDGSVWGRHFGTVHDAKAAYYTYFETWLIAGEPTPNGNVRFETITEVDGDTQFGNENWILTPGGAGPAAFGANLQPADCDTLDRRIEEAAARAAG